mmetsp:Transcript_134/g.153  ORF Transcript_134/g.153 Transcript_134/m.153 type:complete len:1054 (-) Transcript_134:272-3433(-)|eukprot:CAMPEP_0117800780 /NCGR_PEP_ID=MMETSP0948-20121206/14684_1 /TAXON_ID=44440 /ORGANISM="Chattonella subsalsa, Strain CCMP2191" /LENGTH=1053 /DNA_ID=CAMNT_0005633145 /DNA_START=24 /DNA_END=3185 /DNA_ORIENTATION=+
MATRNLLEALDYWTSVQPEKQLFTFLDDAGQELVNVSYKDLTQQSNVLAQKLLSPDGIGVKSGDRVLLVYPPSLDFIIAFLACVRAGVIAVPVFPPDPRKLKKDLYMFKAIQGNCEAQVALTSSIYNYAKKMSDIKGFFSQGESWPTLNWVVTDTLFTEAPSGAFDFKPPSDTDIAFLQYTSGSTSEPKGVMITHGNLKNNLKLIITGLSAVDDTVVVSWLPQYHDMGLIGSYLGCLYCGGSGYYMSPVTFIRNPPLWVELISKYGGTHMQAPNFAYGLVARKFLAKNPHPQIDLSSVRHMINGAEPIDSLTMDRFYAVFEKYGLKHGVVYPTYGLAEHTVYVCSNGSQRLVLDKDALEKERRVVQVDKLSTWMYAEASGASKEEVVKTSVIIGCGKPSESQGVDLVIVDTEEGAVLPEDRVGEIWIRSGSRAAGYWNNEEKTEEDFGGKSDPDDTSDLGYLKTGDLGFLHEGELFICGRKKDLIIIRGRNHYPQDIERTAEGCGNGALRGGCSAAFSVPIPGGGEALTYIGELADPSAVNPAAIAGEIKRTVSANHGAALSHIRLLQPRTVPKTTSGKIARAWCKRAFMEHSLQVVYSLDDDDSAVNEEPTEEETAPQASSTVEEKADGESPFGTTYDAKSMADEDILNICVKEVADLIACDAASLPTDAPLMTLGIDSMGGMQLMVTLENKFRVHLAEDVFFEEGTTLQTLVPIIKCGGQLGPRALLIDTVKFTGIEMVNSDEQMKSKKVRNERLMKCSKKASIMTGRFADGICQEADKKAGKAEEAEVKSVGMQVIVFGLFMAGNVAIFLYFLNIPFALCAIALSVLGCHVAKGYFAKFPAAGRRSPLKLALLKFFNFKVIMEGAHEEGTPELFVTIPNAQIPTGQLLLALTAESVFGKGMYAMINSMLIEVPVVGYYLCAIGARTFSKDLTKKKLAEGCSVGVTAAHSKYPNEPVISSLLLREYIKIAMATGAQIVPCYGFGSAQAQGIFPVRTNVTEAIGEPISLPNTENPSEELVYEYFEMFMKALRKLVKTHGAAYDGNLPEIQLK